MKNLFNNFLLIILLAIIFSCSKEQYNPEIPEYYYFDEIKLILKDTLNENEIKNLVNPLEASKEMTNYVREIVTNSKNEMEKAKKLYNAINNHYKLELIFSTNCIIPLTAKEFFETQKGLCGEYARLYITLCRIAGLKAYYVLSYKTPANKPEYHAATVIFFENNKKMFIDLTYEEFKNIRNKDYEIVNDFGMLADYYMTKTYYLTKQKDLKNANRYAILTMKLYPGQNPVVYLSTAISYFNMKEYRLSYLYSLRSLEVFRFQKRFYHPKCKEAYDLCMKNDYFLNKQEKK